MNVENLCVVEGGVKSVTCLLNVSPPNLDYQIHICLRLDFDAVKKTLCLQSEKERQTFFEYMWHPWLAFVSPISTKKKFGSMQF